jgi:hypothetical protein
MNKLPCEFGKGWRPKHWLGFPLFRRAVANKFSHLSTTCDGWADESSRLSSVAPPCKWQDTYWQTFGASNITLRLCRHRLHHHRLSWHRLTAYHVTMLDATVYTSIIHSLYTPPPRVMWRLAIKSTASIKLTLFDLSGQRRNIGSMQSDTKISGGAAVGFCRPSRPRSICSEM